MTSGYIDLDGTGARLPTDEEFEAVRGGLATVLTGSAVLPSLPLIAIYGDSRCDQCWSTDDLKTTARGFLDWAIRLSNGAARTRANLNFGVGGEDTAEALLRLDTVVASDASIVIIMLGTNDRSHGLSLEDSITNITAIVKALRAAGKTVILLSDTGRGGAFLLSSPQLYYHMSYIAYCERLAATMPGVYNISGNDVFSDPASGSFGVITDYFTDELHHSPKGGYVLGKRIAALLSSILPPVNFLTHSATDLHSASNDRGNLMLNGMLNGTTGTVGANASGVVATSTTLSTTEAAVSAVGSKPADGGQKIVISGTPVAASPLVLLAQNANAALLVPGDVIELACEFDVEDGTAGVIEVGLICNVSTPTLTATTSGLTAGVTEYLPSEAHSGVIVTPPMTIPVGGVTSLRASLTIKGNTGVAMTFAGTFGRMTMRKVGFV